MTDPLDLSTRLQHSLGPSYALQRELGGGGMSRVFVARDESLGRDIVVKVLAPELAAELSAERFAREIRLAARLSHPNIVPLLTAGGDASLPYYMMPLVEGASLRARLATTPLTVAECRWVLRDVAKALAYAHRQGVVHRDVKPENILLAHDTAVVTDFGVARAVVAAATHVPGATLTRAGMSVGTPAYMAPEQAAGDPDVDARADVYAWGLVAYEILSGRHPFAPRRTLHELVIAHLTEAPPPLVVRGGPVPASLVSLVLRCLEKDPALRPASGSEIVAALDSLFDPGEAESLSTAPASATPRVSEPRETAVAVLPFANLSSDPENEYLSDGLTDEIIGTLGRVRGLRVAGRNSCFALKGQSLEPRIVAQRLGVTAVVEGSVRRAGNRIRVSAELVQTADGFQLWSDRYDRDLTDIFAVQEEIAGMIAGALTNRLTTPDPATDTKAAARPENPEAYRLYLQAMHVLRNQFTPDSFDRVIALTENALAADTTLARAHMARAVVHNNLAVYNMRPAHSVCPIALDAARTAVKLDPALAEAWSIEAQVACNYEWDWKRADECFARALAADPDDPGTLARAALFNAARGSEASAVAHARRVMVVDPLSAWSHFVAAAAFRMLRRDDDAASASREALALNPHHGLALTTLAGTLLNQGNVDAAIEGYERACTLTGRNPIPLAGLCIAHAIGKTRDRAESCLAELMAVQRERPSLVWLGYALGALGRLDEAMTCMEQAAEAREFWLAWMNADPFSDVLRSERRFDALMRRVGTPAYRPIETMLGTSAVRLS